MARGRRVQQWRLLWRLGLLGGGGTEQGVLNGGLPLLEGALLDAELRGGAGDLAKAKARRAPRVLQKSAEMAFYNRWTAFLTVAAQRAFAVSLLDLPMTRVAATDECDPDLAEVIAGGCAGSFPSPSHLA